MTRPDVRSWMVVALLGGSAWLSVSACSSGEAAPEVLDKTPRVRSVAIVEVVPSGRSKHLVLLQPYRRARVAPQYGGVIRDLEVDEQQEVEAGDLLVRLAGRDASGSLMTAQGSAASAREKLADARRQLEDIRALADKGAAAAREVEALESQIVTLKAQIRQTRGQVVQARDRKDSTVITAPFSGVVTRIDSEVGEYLAPGQAVLTLSELDQMAIEISLSEREMLLHADNGLEFDISIRSEAVDMKVEWVSPEADTGTATFPARLVLDNPDRKFRAGESVTVNVVGNSGRKRLAVAAGAVRWEGTQAFILRLDGTKVSRVPVRVLEDIDDRRVAIEGEVRPDDRVALGGPSTLVDGDQVIVVPEDEERG